MLDNRVILLVEDNPYDEALTLEAFKASRMANQVVVAHDGVEALDYLFKRGSFAGRSEEESPALILLDLKLPKVDGFEVLQEIRADERTQLIPVVVLTSSKEQEDLVKSYKRGANSYVRKPVDFSAFVEAVKQLEVYWILLNEMP